MTHQEAIQVIVERDERYRRAIDAIRRRVESIRRIEQKKREIDDYLGAAILEAKGDSLDWALVVLAQAEAHPAPGGEG